MSIFFKPFYPSNSEIKSIKKKASLYRAFRFFDTKVIIHSDSWELLEYFELTYNRFLIEAVLDAKELYSFYVLTDSTYPDGPLLLKDDGKTISLSKGKALYDSADTVIFGSILGKIESHFMIHGAALSSQEKGLVLSGLTGSGKTTLAVELTRRGMRFCSDEIAAISRSSHLIDPFPRAIGTRESSLKLLEKTISQPVELHHTIGGEKKWIIDIEDIFENSLSGPCPGKYLILLDTVAGNNDGIRKKYHIINVALKEVAPKLIDTLSDTEGIEYISSGFDGTFHIAAFRVAKKMNVQTYFLNKCKEYEDVILYRVKALEYPPDSEQSPQLLSIPLMDAGLELLGNLQNLSCAEGFTQDTSSENVSHILFELTTAISGMECYRLIVGNLKKTADLVCSLFVRQ